MLVPKSQNAKPSNSYRIRALRRVMPQEEGKFNPKHSSGLSNKTKTKPKRNKLFFSKLTMS